MLKIWDLLTSPDTSVFQKTNVFVHIPKRRTIFFYYLFRRININETHRKLFARTRRGDSTKNVYIYQKRDMGIFNNGRIVRHTRNFNLVFRI